MKGETRKESVWEALIGSAGNRERKGRASRLFGCCDTRLSRVVGQLKCINLTRFHKTAKEDWTLSNEKRVSLSVSV